MSFSDNPSTERRSLKACFVCEGGRLHYLFSIANARVVRCNDCGLMFLNPQPGDAELALMEEQSLGNSGSLFQEVNHRKVSAALVHRTKIQRYHGPQMGDVLEITHENERDLQRETPCDLCVVSEAMEYNRAPLDFLRAVHRALKPEGTLAIVLPTPEGTFARKLGPKSPLQKTYFDERSIQTALLKTGFHEILTESCSTRDGREGMIVYARKTVLRSKQVLSVIVPAFNEAETLDALMTALLRKEIAGLEIEIVIVESNSTDGTRDKVLRHKDHPRVRLILEDRPRGKGHAVRTGLKAATGDYVLIQDADLEYDLEDYDALLEPLVTGREAFVLGSRHGGRNVWKMRQFSSQRCLSLFLNFGHYFFTALINVLFLQRLRDPFTMFKVFRRDCLYGLDFQCNRFDFDYELLIKLIRKGYRPIEWPVNYRSRSFKEGKKVRMFRDPLTWLRALLWLRFVKIDPMEVVENARNPEMLNGNGK